MEIIDGRQKFAEYAYYEIVRSNPNLFKNGYIPGIINQRAKNLYDTNGYAFDVWFIKSNGVCTVSLENEKNVLGKSR